MQDHTVMDIYEHVCLQIPAEPSLPYCQICFYALGLQSCPTCHPCRLFLWLPTYALQLFLWSQVFFVLPYIFSSWALTMASNRHILLSFLSSLLTALLRAFK